MKRIVIWGASGHAKVLLPILIKNNFDELYFIDLDIAIKNFYQWPVYNSFNAFYNNIIAAFQDEKNTFYFAIAIGGHRGPERYNIHSKLINCGFKPISLIHSSAWVAESAQIAEGVQILGMAAISEEVRVGSQTIVNTNATIDHETSIGTGCHIMPGATITGCVQIGNNVTIGSNATILPRIKIEDNAIIGAGAVVTRDVPFNTTVVGMPAKELIKRG